MMKLDVFQLEILWHATGLSGILNAPLACDFPMWGRRFNCLSFRALSYRYSDMRPP